MGVWIFRTFPTFGWSTRLAVMAVRVQVASAGKLTGRSNHLFATKEESGWNLSPNCPPQKRRRGGLCHGAPAGRTRVCALGKPA